MKKNQKILLFMFLAFVGVGLYFYIGKEAFILLTTIVAIYFGISWGWSKFFCQGKTLSDGSIEFNLNRSGEYLIIVYLLSWSLILLMTTIWEWPIWYVWILPVLLSFAYAARAYEVYRNSNDRIIIHGNTIKWQDNGKWVECVVKEFTFKIKKSNCISVGLSLSNLGWHMDLLDQENNSHCLDLKSMNLNGHKLSMEKIINKNLK